MIHYLMIKIHNVTGLKYLCKRVTTSRAICEAYPGSGMYWKRHLQKHGYNFRTEFLEECQTNEELKQKGLYWSEKLDVVNSSEFANLVPEQGTGGPTMKGRRITPEQKKKQSEALRAYIANRTPQQAEARRIANSISHELRIYHTPKGNFPTASTAAIANSCTNVTIINRCVKDNDKPILSRKYWRLGWKGKTWRELGWSSSLKHAMPDSKERDEVLD